MSTDKPNDGKPLVHQRGKWVPYKGNWVENQKKTSANGTLKQAKSIRIKFPGDKVGRFTRIYRPVEEPPPLSEIHCYELYHPVTQKRLHDVDDLMNILSELEQKTHPAGSRFFDPCTKRLLPSFESLRRRVRDIYEYETNSSNSNWNSNSNNNGSLNPYPQTVLEAFPYLVENKFDIPDYQGETSHEESIYFNALCKLFLLFGGVKGVHINPVVGNFEFDNAASPYESIPLTVGDIFKSIQIGPDKARDFDNMFLHHIHTQGEEEEEAVTIAPVCETGCGGAQSTAAAAVSQKKRIVQTSKLNEPLEKTFLLHTNFAKSNYASTKSRDIEPTKLFELRMFDFPLGELYFVNNTTYQIKGSPYRHVFGWDTHVRPFLRDVFKQLKDYVDAYNISYLEAVRHIYFPQKATSLQLQLHQDIIVQGVRKQLAENKDTRFLIGVLPRGGKTFIAGGLIRDFMIQQKVKNMNVVWITAAPNETRLQLQKELVRKFIDFRAFEFVEVKETTDMKKSKPHSIFFLSSQLLTQIKAGKARERKYLSELMEATGDKKISMVFFDEAHKTGVGKSTKEEVDTILEKYKERHLPFIFLTATYYQIMEQYKIPAPNTFIWDYTDVLSSRFLGHFMEKHVKAVETLEVRFGKELVNSVLDRRLAAGQDFNSMAKSYADYPDLHFLSLDFSKDAIELFASQGNYTMNEGFQMWKIMELKKDATVADFKTNTNKIRADAYQMFETPESVEAILTYLTPSSEGAANSANINVPKQSHALLQRIHNISHANSSRFKLSENPSMLMFIPTGRKGTNVFYTMAAWASLLMNHPWWKARYEVACVVDGENLPKGMERREGLVDAGNIHIVSKNVKEHLLRMERDLKCKEKKGLVVLAGEKMSMGVSLPCVDVVMLFNDKSSPDDIIQKMYRAVTPSVGKKTAFIVDLSPKRTLTAVYGYTKISSQKDLSPHAIMNILYKTYHWDTDLVPRGKEQLLLGDKEATFQGMFRRLYANSQTNEKKKTAVEGLISELNRAFTGKKAVAQQNALNLGDQNITHEENIAFLKPYRNQILSLHDSIHEDVMKEFQLQMMAKDRLLAKFKPNAAKKYKENLKAFGSTKKEKHQSLKKLITDYKKLVTKTRKKRQEFIKAEEKAKAAAEAAAVKAKAAQEAAAAKIKAREEAATAKTKAREEALAAKAKAKEEEAARKKQAAEEAAAAKAKAAQEAAKLKAELKTATKRVRSAATATRKKKNAVAVARPATPHTNNTELESPRVLANNTETEEEM